MFTQVRFLTLLPLILAGVLLATLSGSSLAVPDRQPLHEDDNRTITYRFTARTKSNDGVSPFKVGEIIHGIFTYDLEATPRDPARPRHIMYSARNSLSFEMGGTRFSGAGKKWVTIADFDHAEHFGVGAPDLVLPQGWDMDHREGSQTYSVLFQNAPAKGVIAPTGIPERISLQSFVNTRELRLDFFHGVRFPGGQVTGRAVVFANLESLEVVKRRRRVVGTQIFLSPAAVLRHARR